MLTLTDVAIRGPDEVYFAAILDEFADESPDHCMVLCRAGGQVKQRMLDHAVARIVLSSDPSAGICFLGTGATSTFVGAQGTWSEVVDASNDGPSSRLLMRDALWVNGRLHAFGMARMAYERVAQDDWRRIDHGVFVPREQRSLAVGFHAACAQGDAGAVVVGQYGEIWAYAGGAWTQADSLTNVALVDVVGLGDGIVVACGMAGTLLVMSRGHWEVVDSGVSEDLWSVCEFGGKVFAASTRAVYRMGADGSLATVLADVSAAKLSTGFGQLWSVGAKGVFASRDGDNWTAVDMPIT